MKKGKMCYFFVIRISGKMQLYKPLKEERQEERKKDREKGRKTGIKEGRQ